MSWKNWLDDDERSELRPEVLFLDFEEHKSPIDSDPSEQGDVIISFPFPYIGGKPRLVPVGETLADSITVQNTTNKDLYIYTLRISSNPEKSYLLSLMRPPSDDSDEVVKRAFVGYEYLDDQFLWSGETLTVWLSCKPLEIGLHTSRLLFQIEDNYIERCALLLVEDRVSDQSLFMDNPYSRSSGQRKSSQNSRWLIEQLPMYEIPEQIRKTVQGGQVPDVLTQDLDAMNYTLFFCTLITCEEIYLEEVMGAYEMKGALSLIGGTQIGRETTFSCHWRLRSSQGCLCMLKKKYEGVIHRVTADEIFMKFDELMHVKTHRYNVSFTYNRLNSVHELTPDLRQQLLFPFHANSQRVIEGSPFTAFNSTLNQEQYNSVAMILGCKGTPPYVIHGPPGTGKTVTLVEAILQLYTRDEETRILVCSSSKSSSDVLVKLLKSGTTLIHENARMPFCFIDEFKCPSFKELKQYRIIVSTYMSSAILAKHLQRGHFSHIFLDEAGHASEPETMVPITSLADIRTVVVLAGDPLQLGPVVFSRVTETNHLGRSYLERLLYHDNCYAKGNTNYVTRLIHNYRCHPAILELLSEFNGKQLGPCKEISSAMDNLYNRLEIPNKAFPVLFVGIQGCDERQGNNPSWFNLTEASKVMEIFKIIREFDGITSADIGIITRNKH